MRSNKIKVLNTNVHAGDTNLVRAKDYNALHDDVSSVIDGTYRDSVRGYKVYTALLTQSGTAAPVPTILENTIDNNLTWTYGSAGYYIITSTYLKSVYMDKTAVFIQTRGGGLFSVEAAVVYGAAPVLVDYVAVNTYEINNNDGLLNESVNNLLSNTLIEIRVYI